MARDLFKATLGAPYGSDAKTDVYHQIREQFADVAFGEQKTLIIPVKPDFDAFVATLPDHWFADLIAAVDAAKVTRFTNKIVG